MNFLRGALFSTAVTSLIQDIVWGTAEKYSAFVLNNWTARSISIPIALACLFIVYITGKTNG